MVATCSAMERGRHGGEARPAATTSARTTPTQEGRSATLADALADLWHPFGHLRRGAAPPALGCPPSPPARLRSIVPPSPTPGLPLQMITRLAAARRHAALSAASRSVRRTRRAGRPASCGTASDPVCCSAQVAASCSSGDPMCPASSNRSPRLRPGGIRGHGPCLGFGAKAPAFRPYPPCETRTAISSARRSRVSLASGVRKALCAERVTFSSPTNGLPGGSGSSTNTSSAA